MSHFSWPLRLVSHLFPAVMQWSSNFGLKEEF